MLIHLGFVEPIEDANHLKQVGFRNPDYNVWDGGQLGGSPSWLMGPPQPSNVSPFCPACRRSDDDDCLRRRLKFLCQIYAPLDNVDNDDGDDQDRAFHRALYVFVCPACVGKQTTVDGNRNSNGVFVWRAQLPQDNDFYPYDPSECTSQQLEEWKPTRHETASKEEPSSVPQNLCQVCGWPAAFRCPLQNIHVCSKEHQKEYKKYVFNYLKQQKPPLPLPSLYPVYEIAVEEEQLEMSEATNVPQDYTVEDNDGEDDEDRNLEQEDLNRMTGRRTTIHHMDDAVTRKFQQLMRQSHPEQILRYCRWPASATTTVEHPVWIHSQHRLQAELSQNDKNNQRRQQPQNGGSVLPPCPYCGAPRQFEFQLMPQVLSHLSVGISPTAGSTTNDQNNHGKSLVSETAKAALQQTQDILETTPPQQVPPRLAEGRDQALRRYRHERGIQERQLDTETTSEELDFGVVCIYTCTQSCRGNVAAAAENQNNVSPLYLREYAWVQPSLDQLQQSATLPENHGASS